MERLIELAQKIKDKTLRKKVIEFLTNPKLSSDEFKKYKPTPIKEVRVPFSVGNVTVERGDLVTHTVAVTRGCINLAKIIEEEYGIPIDYDTLIAGALLHDLMKIFEWKRVGGEIKHSGIMLDHSFLGVAELYHRNFPEKVIHLVASHFGESGPTPPRNFEALILHYVDSFLSLTEFHLYGETAKQPMQILVVDEETMKKLTGEKSEK